MKTSELIYQNICKPESWKQIFGMLAKYGGIFIFFIDPKKSAEYMIIVNSAGSVIATIIEVLLKNSNETDNKLDNILEAISSGYNDYRK